MNNKKRLVGTVLAAIMVLSIATSALPLSGGIGAEGKVPQLAPLNPDFEAYWENPPETSFGYIPPPVDLSHLDHLPVEGLPTPYAYPSSFDWRDYGKVTPVKDQNPCGTCWVFGTTSVLESAVLIGESVEYNFSEQSVALCVDRSWVYLYDGSTDPCVAGGNSFKASGVFIKKGSVLESCNPYDTSALNCDGSCVCDNCPPIKKVDGYRFATNDGSQIDVIKNAVYYHEPVTVAYYHSGGYEYWDTTWGAIYDYYPCYENPNHLISIIGWDDAVPHPNPNHSGTGAWIVKNSWGTAYPWAGGIGTYDGYFYLAYDSSCAKEIAYLEYKAPVLGEELLYWDEAGPVDSAGYGDNSAWMASVFTAGQPGNLTHVDFWTTSNNAQYEIYVWNGFFGSELAHQTGSCQEYGYYSIPLSEAISMDAGQQFTVGVKMTTPGYGYPIPVEYEIPGLVDPPIQSDVSFVKHTGGSQWTDIAGNGWNACLRARMVSEVAEPDIWVDPTCFDVTLSTNTTQNYTLTIGNDGEATLSFDIHDEETGSSSQRGPAIPTPPAGEVDAEGNLVDFSGWDWASLRQGGKATISIDILHYGPSTEPPRLAALGASVTSITNPSVISEAYLNQFDVFYVGYAAEEDYGSLASKATAIQNYISGGGGVILEQPNEAGYQCQFLPAGFGVAVDDGWWPNYPSLDPLEFTSAGQIHPMLLGLTPDDLAGNFDTVYDSDLGSSYTRLARLVSYPNVIALAVGQHGSGRIVFHTGNICTLSGDPGSDTYVEQMLEWAASGGGLDVPWLDEDPKSGSVEPGNSDEITVSINTTGLSVGEYYANITIANNDPDENPVIIPVHLTVEQEVCYFDTGSGTYPSIMGTHTGTIRPNKTIVVHKMYTYLCVGTGGHTEYVRFYGNGLDVNKTWNGYIGDYHNITFDPPITLEANTTYNYEIRTGSYPQIIHEQSLQTANGTINCTLFTDANSRTYNNWILAMWLG